MVDMSGAIRVLLVLGSLATIYFMLKRIRRSQMQIEDSIFWLIFSVLLMILSIFPDIAYAASMALGFQSPINFVYLFIIFLLLIKQFYMTVRLSQLDNKVRILTQRVALNQEQLDREHLDL